MVVRGLLGLLFFALLVGGESMVMGLQFQACWVWFHRDRSEQIMRRGRIILKWFLLFQRSSVHAGPVL